MVGISQPTPVDPLKTHVQGKPIEDKTALAAANEAETKAAHEMAAQQRGIDAQSEQPLQSALADSIKGKLEELPPVEGEPVVTETPT